MSQALTQSRKRPILFDIQSSVQAKKSCRGTHGQMCLEIANNQNRRTCLKLMESTHQMVFHLEKTNCQFIGDQLYYKSTTDVNPNRDLIGIRDIVNIYFYQISDRLKTTIPLEFCCKVIYLKCVRIDTYLKVLNRIDLPKFKYVNLNLLQLEYLDLPILNVDGVPTNTINQLNKHPEGTTGYVYQICEHDNDNGYTQLVKIGYSKNPQTHARQLNTGNPRELIVDQTISSQNPRQLKRILHLLFQTQRVRGDWFQINSNLTSIFDEYLNLANESV